MQLLLAHYSGIILGWLSALRDFRSNPLPAIWTGHRRLKPRMSWPGILLSVAGFCICCFYIYFPVATLYERPLYYHYRNPMQKWWEILYPLDIWWLGAPWAALCMLLSIIWVLVALFNCMRVSLGFLEQNSRSLLFENYDDMLASSQLSEYEVLLAVSLRNLRLMFLPMLALAVSLSYVQLIRAHDVVLNHRPPEDQIIYIAVLSLVSCLIGGLLTTIALGMLGVSLSLASRMNGQPLIGAVLIILMQLWFLVMAYYDYWSDPYWRWSGTSDRFFEEFMGSLRLLSWLVVGLLLYLSRRINWLRLSMQVGFPVILASLYGLASSQIVLESSGYFNFATVLAMANLSMQPLSILATESTRLLPLVVNGNISIQQLTSQAGYQLLWQLAWIILFAEFARDAVRRRKWGEA